MKYFFITLLFLTGCVGNESRDKLEMSGRYNLGDRLSMNSGFYSGCEGYADDFLTFNDSEVGYAVVIDKCPGIKNVRHFRLEAKEKFWRKDVK